MTAPPPKDNNAFVTAIIEAFKPHIIQYARNFNFTWRGHKPFAELIAAWPHFDAFERQDTVPIVQNALGCWASHDHQQIEDLLALTAAIWPLLAAEKRSSILKDLTEKLTAQMEGDVNMRWKTPTMGFILAHADEAGRTSLALTTWTQAKNALANACDFETKTLPFLLLLVLVWPHLPLKEATEIPTLIFTHIRDIAITNGSWQFTEYKGPNLFVTMQAQWQQLSSPVRQHLAKCSAEFILDLYHHSQQTSEPISMMPAAILSLWFARALDAAEVVTLTKKITIAAAIESSSQIADQ